MSLRGSARAFMLVAAALVGSGCASAEGRGYSEHLMDMDHAWHAVPAYGGLGAGIAPFLPLSLTEHLLGGPDPLAIDPPGFFGGCGIVLGFCLAHVLGTPFYVLGLPFEGAPAAPDAAAEQE